jgi:hypothetical protein
MAELNTLEVSSFVSGGTCRTILLLKFILIKSYRLPRIIGVLKETSAILNEQEFPIKMKYVFLNSTDDRIHKPPRKLSFDHTKTSINFHRRNM